MGMEDFNNMWSNDQIKNMVEKYNNKEEMSWVSKADQEAIDIDKSDNSINWGIPNQIIGDYKNANLYLCLLNPRTRTDTSSVTTLDNYIEYENKNGGEFFDDKIEEYSKHVIDPSENILAEEIGRLLKRDHSPKVIQNVVDKIVSFTEEYFKTKDVNTTKVNKTKAAVNDWKKFGDDMNLSNKFRISCIKELNRLLKDVDNLEISADFKADLIAEIDNKWLEKRIHLDDLDQASINYFDYKMVNRFLKQLDDELNPLNDLYYFNSYYWALLTKGKVSSNGKAARLDYFEKIYQTNKIGKAREKYIAEMLSKYNGYKICNLELFPYRSNNFEGISYQEGKSLLDVESVQRIARLIIDRIDADEDNRNLRFVFRAYRDNAWRGALKRALADKYPDKNNAEINGLLNSKYGRFFYKFPNQNASLSQGNFYRVRIDDDEYEQIQNSVFENNN